MIDSSALFRVVPQMYEEIWSARNDPSVKTIVYEAFVADGLNQYLDHLPVIADYLGLKDDDNDDDDNNNNNGTISDEEKALYRKVAALVSREEMLKHTDKFRDNFIATAMGKKQEKAIRIMERTPFQGSGPSRRVASCRVVSSFRAPS
mmetsp:Transcript_17421/g.48112  ORF Transcript_17421/g.48112 Transcript_17421/m.48112 type:complete len:148 (-) Transcript_17421:596-1039(-)